MKKRLLSFMLAALMILTAVISASCGAEEEDPTLDLEKDKARAMTLTIWGVKGKGTTDEAVALVEEKMSSITEAQFNTAIKLMLFEEDEYEKALEAKMDAIQAQLDKEAEEAEAKKKAEKEAKKNKDKNKETTKKTETTETTEAADETILDENGFESILYPEVEDTQLDIFLITDYEMFQKYHEKEVLSALDEQLSSSSKLLKSYVHPIYMEAGKIDGKKTYAIVNSKYVGEYTYLLCNRELMDKYYYDIDDMNLFSDTLDFIIDVNANDPDYIPVMGNLEPLNLYYGSIDGTESIVGGMFEPSMSAGGISCPKILLADINWKNHLIMQKKLEAMDCVGPETVTPNDKFGVAIIKGDAMAAVPYEENYYTKVLMYPQATEENVCKGAFAVSTYTKNLARSMEILTYLNTKQDLINTFAYGVEGVHYELDPEGVVRKLSKDYNMDLNYVGNNFMLYPPEGTYAEYWLDARAQNLDTVKYVYWGFSFEPEEMDAELDAYAKDYYKKFMAAYEQQPAEGIEEWLSDQWDITDTDEKLQAWGGNAAFENPTSYPAVYTAWFNIAYPYKG